MRFMGIFLAVFSWSVISLGETKISEPKVPYNLVGVWKRVTIECALSQKITASEPDKRLTFDFSGVASGPGMDLLWK